MCSADGEAGQALWFFRLDLDRLDLSSARASPAERNQSLDRILVALEHRLDRAVPAVRHPAGDAVLLREAPRRVAKEHALHVAVDDDAAPDHAPYSRPRASEASTPVAAGGTRRSRRRRCMSPPTRYR